jgi:hypothetical protein
VSGAGAVPSWQLTPEKGFLSAAQEQQLDAIFSRLLPADRARGIPGAIEAGASRFVSLLLARDASVFVEIPDWKELYPASLEVLDAWARAMHGATLVDLGDEPMNALIAGLETNSLTDLPKSVNQPLLFKTLLRHCLQGSFADPRWGGNRDGVMWRWIGYPSAPEDVR